MLQSLGSASGADAVSPIPKQPYMLGLMAISNSGMYGLRSRSGVPSIISTPAMVRVGPPSCFALCPDAVLIVIGKIDACRLVFGKLEGV